jgi:hypothetical protein
MYSRAFRTHSSESLWSQGKVGLEMRIAKLGANRIFNLIEHREKEKSSPNFGSLIFSLPSCLIDFLKNVFEPVSEYPPPTESTCCK